MKLVQMPANLLHIEDADLDGADVEPGILEAFRAYLPTALDERRGLVILAAGSDGGQRMLMLLARRIGAALRDENIRRRDSGNDMAVRKLRLCYLPGELLHAALHLPQARAELAREAACFFQSLDSAWTAEYPGSTPRDATALLGLLDERLAAGRPTFLNAVPDRLLPGLEDALRARLPILEERSSE
jgi:hypothetical protein